MAGCRGSARVQFVSLQSNAIDPPDTRVWEYDAGACHWWENAAGEICLAAQCEKDNILAGRFGHVRLILAVKLGKPPAGSGLNYTIRPGQGAVCIETALEKHRFDIYNGVACAIREGDNGFRGSFRLWAINRPAFSPFMFLQQQGGSSFLVFGPFHAVHDAQGGAALWNSVFEVPSPTAASQPASRPETSQ